MSAKPSDVRNGTRLRWILAAAVAAGLLVAGVAVAATGVLAPGGEIAGDEPPAPGQPPTGFEETVLATGSTPIAGPWQITSHESQEIVDAGEVVQPAGLPCLRILLRTPPRQGTPIPGAGYCGEAGVDGFNVASVPASDGEGDIEVILWGPAPEEAATVQLVADGGRTMKADTYEGPPDFTGDVWVMAVPHTLGHAQVVWLDKAGREGGPRLDASSDLERGYDLESFNE